MAINCEIRVYVCAPSQQERLDWVNKIAHELRYATVTEAIGVTRDWGTEYTSIVSCLYDNENRDWSWYDDVLPCLVSYKFEENQDVLAVYVSAHGRNELHLVITNADLNALTTHVCAGF